MKDKEKETIERLNRILIAESTTNNIGTRVYISDLRIVLNLTEKQKAEIEEYRKIGLRTVKENNNMKKSLKGIINNQNKEIKTLKRDFEIVDHECSRLEQEDIRKDMMINLMAKWLYEDDNIFGFGIFKEINTPEKIIKYFENKVKENK